MITPTSAIRTRAFTLLLAAGTLFLAACSNDVTAPRASTMLPAGPNMSLMGATDGVYTFVVQPGQSQILRFGQSQLYVPANSICSLGTSGYGTSFWNSSCTPERLPVTITATVTNAKSSHPRVDFFPALRFNPAAAVILNLTVSDAATVNSMTVLKYCDAKGVHHCIDESLTDPTLFTAVYHADVWHVFRRIKHFSGYMVSE